MARSFVSAFLGHGEIDGFDAKSLRAFIRYNDINDLSIGQLIHEAAHLECHSTIFHRVVQRLALDFLDSRISLSAIEKVYTGLPYTDSAWRFLYLLDLYRPILEGISYFAEFELSWDDLASLKALSRLQNVFDEEDLLRSRSDAIAQRRRMDLLSRPFLPNGISYSNSCDTCGYYLLKRAHSEQSRCVTSSAGDLLSYWIGYFLDDDLILSVLMYDIEIPSNVLEENLKKRIARLIEQPLDHKIKGHSGAAVLVPDNQAFTLPFEIPVSTEISPGIGTMNIQDEYPATVERIHSEYRVKTYIRGSKHAIDEVREEVRYRKERLISRCNETQRRLYLRHAEDVQILNRSVGPSCSSVVFMEEESDHEYYQLFSFSLSRMDWMRAGIGDAFPEGRLYGDMSTFLEDDGSVTVEFFVKTIEIDGQFVSDGDTAHFTLNFLRQRFETSGQEKRYLLSERTRDKDVLVSLLFAPNCFTLGEDGLNSLGDRYFGIGKHLEEYYKTLFTSVFEKGTSPQLQLSRQHSLLGDSKDDLKIFELIAQCPFLSGSATNDCSSWWEKVPPEVLERVEAILGLLGYDRESTEG